jgi:ArsR family transcriptional regulator
MPDLLKIMKSLSDKTRLNLVKLFLEHDFCVGALARRLSVSESAVSQHLKVLRTAGLVKGDKRGYFTHYYVNRELLKWVANEFIILSETEQIYHSCQKRISSDKDCCNKSIIKDKTSNQLEIKSSKTD